MGVILWASFCFPVYTSRVLWDALRFLIYTTLLIQKKLTAIHVTNMDVVSKKPLIAYPYI